MINQYRTTIGTNIWRLATYIAKKLLKRDILYCYIQNTRWQALGWQIASSILENFCDWRYLTLQQNFVAATSHKIKSARICETCCGDKVMLQRPRFGQKFSSTHKAICRCDLLCNLLQQLIAQPLHTEWFVTVTCCSNSLPSVLRPLACTAEKCGLVYELVSSTEEQWPTLSL